MSSCVGVVSDHVVCGVLKALTDVTQVLRAETGAPEAHTYSMCRNVQLLVLEIGTDLKGFEVVTMLEEARQEGALCGARASPLSRSVELALAKIQTPK